MKVFKVLARTAGVIVAAAAVVAGSTQTAVAGERTPSVPLYSLGNGPCIFDLVTWWETKQSNPGHAQFRIQATARGIGAAADNCSTDGVLISHGDRRGELAALIHITVDKPGAPAGLIDLNVGSGPRELIFIPAQKSPFASGSPLWKVRVP
jgi:hypothetical protein